jgi:N-acetylmuramoyl-L-alanine amidase
VRPARARIAWLALGALLLCAPPARAARPDAILYEEATRARAALEASRKAQQSRVEWEKVVARFQRVVSRYAKSGYCDDALLAEGDLYREMARRFGRTAYREQAVEAYKSLADEYPSSRLGEGALYSVFEIAQESGDKKRLSDAGKAYLGVYPDAKRAPLVKAALRQKVPQQAASLPSPPPPGLVQVFDLRFWSGESSTRVVIDLEKKVEIQSDRIKNPDRLWVDLVGARLHPKLQKREFAVGDGLLEKVRVGANRDRVVRVVLDFKSVKDHSIFYLDNPLRLVIDVRGTPKPAMASLSPVRPPKESPAEARPRGEPVAETVPDADDDAAVDDPTAPRRPLKPSPTASSKPDGPPKPEPTATPPDRLPSRRLNALLRPEPPPPGAPSTEPPVVIGSALPGNPDRTDKPADRRTPGGAIPLAAASAPPPVAAPSAPQPPAVNRAGSYSLARQLGLGARRIVIDPGHGGHDPGTIGRGGLQEKDLVLDVSLRLEKMVRSELGAEVIMTRSTDAYVPLEERTAIANAKGADLFLSVHANSSRNPIARGIETYFLNFAKNPHAEEVAARENAISAATLKDLQGLVKAITLNSKIEESHDFASSIQEAMVQTVRGRYPVEDRGIHTAPFYVLIGANMPSILAEIAFVSHPEDEKLLKTPEYRETIARSLFKGVKAYLEGLSRNQSRALTSLPGRSTVAEGGSQ